MDNDKVKELQARLDRVGDQLQEAWVRVRAVEVKPCPIFCNFCGTNRGNGRREPTPAKPGWVFSHLVLNQLKLI